MSRKVPHMNNNRNRGLNDIPQCSVEKVVVQDKSNSSFEPTISPTHDVLSTTRTEIEDTFSAGNSELSFVMNCSRIRVGTYSVVNDGNRWSSDNFKVKFCEKGIFFCMAHYVAPSLKINLVIPQKMIMGVNVSFSIRDPSFIVLQVGNKIAKWIKDNLGMDGTAARFDPLNGAPTETKIIFVTDIFPESNLRILRKIHGRNLNEFDHLQTMKFRKTIRLEFDSDKCDQEDSIKLSSSTNAIASNNTVSSSIIIIDERRRNNATHVLSIHDEDILDQDPYRRDLVKEIKCVDCQEVPMKEIFNCNNGHIICDKCKTAKNYFSCSICASATTNIRNRLAETVVSKLSFKCKNSVQGCTQILSSSNIMDHMKEYCSFRPISCFVGGKVSLCKGELVPFGEYLSHLKDIHHFSCQTSSDSTISTKIIRPLQCDSLTEDYTWPLSCISFDGQVFFQHAVFYGSSAFIWVSILSGSDLPPKYFATVVLVKKFDPTPKMIMATSKIPVQNFRTSFEQIKANGDESCLILTKDQFVVLSTAVDNVQEEEQNDDVLICKYSWTLHTTVSKE